jgi:malonate decarboxylase delta subunit
MEQLLFEFAGKRQAHNAAGHALIGVVASGNLEVMVEPAALNGRMRVVVSTAAQGFAGTWEAVLADFHARHPLADVPRLDQRRRGDPGGRQSATRSGDGGLWRMSRRYREHSYYESNARERLFGVMDEESFREFVGPRARAPPARIWPSSTYRPRSTTA